MAIGRKYGLSLAWWFFDSTFGGVIDYGDDDAILAVGSFDWIWEWEEGSKIYTGLWSKLSPSNSSNAAWTPRLRLGTLYRMSRRWELEASWETNYFRNLGGLDGFHQERLTHQIRAGVNYRLYEGWRARAYVEETVSDSRADIGTDWDRFGGWVEVLFAN